MDNQFKSQKLIKKNWSIKPVFFILLIFATASYCFGQQATVTLERNQILLGEQVTLQLKVDNIINDAQKLDSWFILPDSANHIQVVHRDKIDTLDQDGRTMYLQKLIITSFDSGKWVLQLVAPKVKDVNGQVTSLNYDSVNLEILPVNVQNLKDFHPLKEILPVDYHDYRWIYWLVGSILFLGVIFLVIKIVKRIRNKKSPATSTIIKGPPLDWALEQIKLLEQEDLINKGEAKQFFTRLYEICRIYFDERTGSHTLQSTSYEMIASLRSYLIKEKDRSNLNQFSQLSNRVKFAEHNPNEQIAKSATLIAVETLSNIEKQVIEINRKDAH